LLATIFLVFISMMLKDIMGNSSIYLVSKGHGLWAGVADGLSDIASVLSIGITAVVTSQHGWSLETVLAMAALFLGSILGGIVGTRLGKSASDRIERDKVVVVVSK
jgi:hypothetical protein